MPLGYCPAYSYANWSCTAAPYCERPSLKILRKMSITARGNKNSAHNKLYPSYECAQLSVVSSEDGVLLQRHAHEFVSYFLVSELRKLHLGVTY